MSQICKKKIDKLDSISSSIKLFKNHYFTHFHRSHSCTINRENTLRVQATAKLCAVFGSKETELIEIAMITILLYYFIPHRALPMHS